MSDDLVKREYLIFKAGRGWYRPDSKGYTSFKFDAGRYSEDEAKRITNPNGLGGPRDGMFYKHESEVHDYPSTRIEELEAKLAELEPKDGRPCATDEFLAVILDELDDNWDIFEAIKDWVEGDWVNAVQGTTIAELKGEK